jgi:hypothetical protein
MKKFIGFIFMILTCCYNACFAEIIKANDIKGIEETVNSIDTEIDKGKALKAFLNHYKLKFKKIIFIDDRKKNLESVEKTISKLNIPFVGIEYTAAVMHTEPLNEKRAKLQFKTLSKEKKWISDSEADALLTNSVKVK